MSEEIKVEIIDSPSMELCHALSEMQRTVWGISDLDRIPPWKIFITPKIGGLIIVAFDQSEPIGHAIFTHAHNNPNTNPYMYLDLIGVLPEYHGQSIGEKIILESKEYAIYSEYTSIQWTYDPLEGANANLYIGKLGGVVINFFPNYFGQLSGKRHQGSPTDRFMIKLDPDAQPKIHEKIDITITQQTYNRFESLITKNPNTVAIEFPVDFQNILTESPEKAQNIRQGTRNLFTVLLNRGYCINGFVRKKESNCYIAEKIRPM